MLSLLVVRPHMVGATLVTSAPHAPCSRPLGSPPSSRRCMCICRIQFLQRTRGRTRPAALQRVCSCTKAGCGGTGLGFMVRGTPLAGRDKAGRKAFHQPFTTDSLPALLSSPRVTESNEGRRPRAANALQCPAPQLESVIQCRSCVVERLILRACELPWGCFASALPMPAGKWGIGV